jgi:IrrE N-terminal-like domain
VEARLEASYIELVVLLWERLASPTPAPAPTLHVVHSPIARPTSVRTNAGDHVIFDQYLGQLFSRLTRIEMSDAPAQVVDAYLFRLYGQRLLIAGMSREAAAFALASKSTATDDEREHALAEDEEQLRIRSLMTHVQEAFAIGHELMHLALHDDATYRELSEVFDDVIERAIAAKREAAKARTDDGRMSLFNRQYLDDVLQVYRRRGIDTADLAEPDDPDSYFADADDIDLPAVFVRPDVRLEAMCDLFAATSVANVLGDIGLTAIDVMATTTLALQHLRLVQLLDNFVSGQESPIGLDDYCLQSIARVTLLRTGLGFALQLSMQHADSANEVEVAEAMNRLHQAAVRLNRLHTGVVLDNLLLGLDLPRIGEALLADPSVATTIDNLSSNTRLLRSVLGFPAREG